MGQLLSIPAVIGGILVLIISSKNARKTGSIVSNAKI
jgi:prolipoprotein diacylglyceryltransferase